MKKHIVDVVFVGNSNHIDHVAKALEMLGWQTSAVFPRLSVSATNRKLVVAMEFNSSIQDAINDAMGIAVATNLPIQSFSCSVKEIHDR